MSYLPLLFNVGNGLVVVAFIVPLLLTRVPVKIIEFPLGDVSLACEVVFVVAAAARKKQLSALTSFLLT